MASRVRTPLHRGSFCHLVTPYARKAKGDEKQKTPAQGYSIVLPKDKKTTNAFLESLKASIDEACVDKFGKKIKHTALKHYPIHDGDNEDEDGNVRPEHAGCWIVRVSNTKRVPVIEKNGTPIVDDDVCYSGAWYISTVSAWAWDHETGGKGASINLHATIKMKDDEPWAGVGVDPQEEFADLISSSDDEDDEDDEPAPPKAKTPAKKAPKHTEDDALAGL